MSRNFPIPKFKSTFRKAPDCKHEKLGLTTVDGVYLHGVIGDGYLNGKYVCLMEFQGAGEDYRWIFNEMIPEQSLALILLGLRHDPSYREQFKKPARLAEEADPVALRALVSKAFGDHTIYSNGSVERGPHPWESSLRIVLEESAPVQFVAFARKCPYLEIGKIRGMDCITVNAPLGNASQANLLLIQAIEDFSRGQLGNQDDYTLIPVTINTWPTKPKIISSNSSDPIEEKPSSWNRFSDVESKPTLKEKLLLVTESTDPAFKKRVLPFLKAGRDEFSRMKAAEVQESIAPSDRSKIQARIKKPENQIKAMRWHLRGLSITDAIEKIELDAEALTKLIDRKKAYETFGRD